MERKDFIKAGVLTTGLFLLDKNSAFARAADDGLDQLTDEKGQFQQAPLPYSFNHLEPYMDEETLNLHYKFHHGGAVKGANKDLAEIRTALDGNSVETVDFWTKKLSYHFSSHILHTIFWTNLTNRKTAPMGKLLQLIERDFGTYDKLKAYIAETAKNVDGNGWGILAWQPYAKKLTIMQCENHERLTQWGAIPILVIDAWEHAYYLKYRNKRADFVDALFNIIDWDNVAMRLNAAMKIG
jgi:Fe-Mn family superoxide dismutase